MIALLGAVSLLQFCYYFLWVPFSMHGVDFTVLWRTARQVWEGHPTYVPPAVLIGPDHWEVFKYPQFLAVVCAWLGALELSQAEVVWKILMVACSLGCGILAASLAASAAEPQSFGRARAAVCSPTLARVGAFLALSSYSSFGWSIELGQVGPLLALLVLGAYAAARARRQAGAGAVLAVAALVKVLPSLLVVQAMFHRRWRVVAAAAAVALSYGAVLVVLGRLDDELHYFRVVVPKLAYLAHPVSYSLIEWLILRFSPEALASPERFVTVQHSWLAVMLFFYFLAMATLVRRGCRWLDGLTPALVGLLVLSPVVEGHHYVILWAAWVHHYLLFLRGKINSWRVAVLTVCWLPIFLSASFHKHMTAEEVRFIPTFATLALWFASLEFAFSACTPARPASPRHANAGAD